MQAGEEERHSGEEAPEGAGGPGDREEAQHDREGCPLQAKECPEQGSVEVPYPAREGLQMSLSWSVIYPAAIVDQRQGFVSPSPTGSVF